LISLRAAQRPSNVSPFCFRDLVEAREFERSDKDCCGLDGGSQIDFSRSIGDDHVAAERDGEMREVSNHLESARTDPRFIKAKA
jgi:hypothetical protein